ncbi:MAG: SUMF1/EgtB/PvdO family nonheme iron enzyme, partial [Acidobacteriota bacterium]
RTQSVEMMIEELRMAIEPSAFGIHTTSGGGSSFAASSLNILTEPPQSAVYLDNVAVGQSREDGWLMLEGMQSGTHHLRISHNGFQDWNGSVTCDGRPLRVVAQLQAGGQPASATVAYTGGAGGGNTPHNFASTHGDQELQRTAFQNWDTGRQNIGVKSQPPAKKSFFSPLVIGAAALMGLFVLGVLGVGGAFMAGLIGPKRAEPPNVANNASPTPSASPKTSLRADLVAIPGGSFVMGRSDGAEIERPEHEVTVADFNMDKTEVTNAEYSQFVQDTNYKDLPAHWVNGKPIAGQETMPVRFVSAADADAFAQWRSKRDGVTYRLPTEQEWEYAARNGAKRNLYPWGDKFEAHCAMIDQANNEPASVGSKSCPDSWGVFDLIGNVFEWTGTEASLYPGSSGAMKNLNEKHLMVRGGSSFQKSSGPNAITSTFRIAIPASRRSAELGFRLVRTE